MYLVPPHSRTSKGVVASLGTGKNGLSSLIPDMAAPSMVPSFRANLMSAVTTPPSWQAWSTFLSLACAMAMRR